MSLQDRQVLEPSGPPAPVRRPVAPVSIAIIVISVAVFLLEKQLGARQQVVLNGEVIGQIQYGALYGPLVATGQWWRVLGTVFEHGGLLHLALNMSVVWTLGQALERAIGSWRFALVSLVTALGSSAMALFFAFDSVTVGASGMILGWAGTMLPISTKQGRQGLVVWLVQVAAISLLPGVSWQGHLGGFVAGLPAGWALRGGVKRFRWAAPILLFVLACIAVVAGSGRLVQPAGP